MTTALPDSLLDLDGSGLTAWLADQGEPAFRARQVQRHLAAAELDPTTWTDIPRRLREFLAGIPALPLQRAAAVTSRDGLTHKLLLRAADGTTIETVLMLYPDPGDPGHTRRRTACVSTQAGCAIGCTFCATARLGLDRNLTPGEIVAQVLFAAGLVRDLGLDRDLVAGERLLTNLVFMGMGEPFANYDRMRQAILWLTDPAGFGLGTRHITVSTAGLVPGIRRFATEPWQAGLAVSLHAPRDDQRSRLMPINDRYPIAEVMAACRDYAASTGRRVTFEYVLIAGENDHPADAEALADLLRGLPCHVNLIPMNPIGDGPFRRAAPEDVREFQRIVTERGIACTTRQERGVEIYGACGQLRRYTPAGSGREELQPGLPLADPHGIG